MQGKKWSQPRRKWSQSSKREMEGRLRRLQLARASMEPSEGLLAELRLARECLGLGVMEEERALATSCWIEYGYLRAYQRTELFTQAYESEFRRFHSKYRDQSTAGELLPINPELAGNTPSEITQLWKGRQHADAIGMPYTMFIGQAMESMLINEGHKKIPRPNQLYSVKPIKHVIEYWEKWRGNISLFDEGWDPRFRAENFAGEPVQMRGLDLIEERVNDAPSGGRARRLGNYLVRNRAITESEARRRFGDALVDEVATRVGPIPAAERTSRHSAPAPGCLGTSWSQGDIACQACPVVVICKKLIEKLDREFIEACGDPDPKAAKNRQDASRRKREQRARQQRAAA